MPKIQSKSKPLVSVIMNCFNGEEYLHEAIDSVYKQTYDNWEIIFWDNASTDNSAEIARLSDSRLKYFLGKEKIPLGAARRKAVEKSSGLWIGFLDADDLWYPDKLSVQIQSLVDTNYVFCYGGIHEIRPDGGLIRECLPHSKSGFILEEQLFQFDINMVTPLVKKSIMDKYSIHFEDNITTSEEYNLFLRVLAKGKACTISKPLGAWRIADGTNTDRNIKNWSDESFFTLDQLKKENPGIEELYPEAFREANARGVYYKARYLMKTKKYMQARLLMSEISKISKKYLILYLFTFSPFFWNRIHSSILKRKLALKILGY